MRRTLVLIITVVLLFPTVRMLQAQEDPLSEKDANQVRESRDRPNDRIKLYQKFIDQRLSAIKDLNGKTRVDNRDAQLRDKFEEFTRLADELSDNLDTYGGEHADLRKTLKDLAVATAKWLPVLNSPPPDPVYDFSRKTALEAAQSTIDQVKKLQSEQDKYFAEHKNH